MGRTSARLRVVLVGLAVVLSLCGGRLLQLQAFDPEAYATAATKSLTDSITLAPVRGAITGRDGTVLASTEVGYDIVSDPTITGPHASAIAAIVAQHVGGTPAGYLPSLQNSASQPNRKYAIVAKRVPATVYDAVAADMSAADLGGLFPQNDPIRSYPGGTLAAQIIGSVGGDSGGGLNGLEYALNSQLAGTPGHEAYEQASDGSKIPLGEQTTTPAVNGTSYQLTIDPDLQWMAQQRLAARQAEVGAKSGIAITIDIKTGHLLAMASTPGYDANDPGKATNAEMTDHAISDAYEPGSVEKILTMAAVIDSGHGSPQTKLTVPGALPSGDGLLHDEEAHGTELLTATGAFAKSSNIGTALMARRMPKAQLQQYLTSFGLGQAPQLGLPGEAAGHVPNADMPDYARDQIAFGQGISVSAVQLAAAAAGILNGGVYNPPTLIESATDGNGNAVSVPKAPSRRVVSAQTSKDIAEMMESVVGPGGTGSTMAIPGYLTGAKTGTAQRINPGCGCYDGGGIVTSYMAMAPADNPRILTYVVLDRPTRNTSGVSSAGPVATDLLKFAMNRYGIWPSATKPTYGSLTW